MDQSDEEHTFKHGYIRPAKIDKGKWSKLICIAKLKWLNRTSHGNMPPTIVVESKGKIAQIVFCPFSDITMSLRAAEAMKCCFMKDMDSVSLILDTTYRKYDKKAMQRDLALPNTFTEEDFQTQEARDWMNENEPTEVRDCINLIRVRDSDVVEFGTWAYSVENGKVLWASDSAAEECFDDGKTMLGTPIITALKKGLVASPSEIVKTAPDYIKDTIKKVEEKGIVDEMMLHACRVALSMTGYELTTYRDMMGEDQITDEQGPEETEETEDHPKRHGPGDVSWA